jgi:hypothetical protein
VYLFSFFNLGTRWGCVVNATPRPLYPWERPSTYCIGGWVGPRAGLDRCRKSRPPPGFNSRTVQPVVSCYTDCTILANIMSLVLLDNLFRVVLSDVLYGYELKHVMKFAFNIFQFCTAKPVEEITVRSHFMQVICS